MIDYFEDLVAKTVEFAQHSDRFDEIAQKVTGSDLIYLPCGITLVLVERLKNARVDKSLREYGKGIFGNSAGALARCRDCILMNGKENPETKIILGLGLADRPKTTTLKEVSVQEVEVGLKLEKQWKGFHQQPVPIITAGCSNPCCSHHLKN